MNVARKLETPDTDFAVKSTKAKGAEVVYLAGRKKVVDKKVTLDYLNEKLAYFYANGGPVMDI